MRSPCVRGDGAGLAGRGGGTRLLTGAALTTIWLTGLAWWNAARVPPLRPREAQVVWKEKKGPRCVAMKNIVRMEAVQRDSIDLITRQKQLLRAQLNRGCRALDFYAGFYMKGNKDGQLCEGRDEIHARTGAKCEVDEFRLLVPVARDDD